MIYVCGSGHILFMSKAELELVSDWADYDKSLIYSLSDDYFKLKGIDAYASKKNKNIIPNAITNSYPHAKSIARIIKANLANYPEDYKLTILECGAGSGIFARNLLMALKEFQILDRVLYLVTDLSRSALLGIEELGILKGFDNYKLLELDLCDLESCKTLDGNRFSLENISVTILNYVYDALPMIVLRKNQSSQKTKYEKLQLRFLKDESIKKDITENTSFLKNLTREERWKNYNLEQQSDAEKKYFDLLEQVPVSDNAGQIYYNYGSLSLTEKLLEISDDNAFIMGSDMVSNPNALISYEIYGNTTAHAVNDALITALATKLDYGVLASADVLMRIFVFKNKKQSDLFVKVYSDEFITKNDVACYLDLRKAINIINSNFSHEILKDLVNRLLKIDGASCISYIAAAKYCEFIGDNKAAIEQYNRALKLDFLDDYNLNNKIKSLL